MSSNGDKLVYLQPGQKGMPVRAGGDFIFLKAAQRAVRVIVDGQPVVMREGDKRVIPRKEPGRLAFDSFEVDNTSGTLPLSCVFVVGEGDFNSQIIRGNINALSGVLGADGLYRADRRYWRDLYLNWDDRTVESYAMGDNITSEQVSITSQAGGFMLGEVVYIVDYQANIEMFDRTTGDHLGSTNLASAIGIGKPVSKLDWFHHDIYENNYLVIDQNKDEIFEHDPDLPGVPAWAEISFSAPLGGKIQGIARDPVTGYYAVWHYLNSSNVTLSAYDENKAYLHHINLPTGVNGKTEIVGFYKSENDANIDWLFYNYGGDGGSHYLDREDFLLRGVETHSSGAGTPDVNTKATYQGVTDEKRKKVFTHDSYRGRWIAYEDFGKSGSIYVGHNRHRVLLPEAMALYGVYQFGADETGRITATGEIVKAGIAGLLGRNVKTADDYLDHIFQVIFTPGITNNAGSSVINAGYESWKAANIADNFTVKLPVRLQIYTDL